MKLKTIYWIVGGIVLYNISGMLKWSNYGQNSGGNLNDNDSDNDSDEDLDDDYEDVIVDTETQINDDYREPEILTDDYGVYEGVIPNQFKPEYEISQMIGGANLNDPQKFDISPDGNDLFLINDVILQTGQSYNLGAPTNEFTLAITYVNGLTFEFSLTQNYTGSYTDGVAFYVDGQNIGGSMFTPYMYQFGTSGTKEIDVEITGGNNDFDDYSSDAGLTFLRISFNLVVPGPNESPYSSGTTNVEFTDYTEYQND